MIVRPYLAFALLPLVVTACASKVLVEPKIQDPALRAYSESLEGRKFLEALLSLQPQGGSRGPASVEVAAATEGRGPVKTGRDRAATEAAIYLEGQPTRFIAAPAEPFMISSDADKAELEKLKTYLLSKSADLMVEPGLNGETDLKLTSISKSGTRTIIRLQQLVARHMKQKFGYAIPIAGSGVVVHLEKDRLVSVHSTLAVPPSVSYVLKNPGFDLSGLSAGEFETLLSHLRLPSNPAALSLAFKTIAKASSVPFDFDAFVKFDPRVQREQLTDLFSRLGPVSTFKLMIELARLDRLALSRHGEVWMFEITQLFDLPLRFDVEIPSSANEKLRVRNMRLLNQDVSISVYNSPQYPGPSQVLVSARSEYEPIHATGDGTTTAEYFQKILQYYQQYHNWFNYRGQDPSGKLDVFVNVKSPYATANNAMWSPSERRIIVGSGGETLANLGTSISVMSHEFTHAVVEYTSRLVYEGESGALNEHFADVQGVLIEAEVKQKPFSFVMGSDSLNQAAVGPRRALLSLILPQLKVSPEEIRKYNYDVIGLRHMMKPALSYSTSYSSTADGAKAYGYNCQPKDDNDYCGVHSLSGIPNRAVSLIIDALGIEKTRTMIFNTVTQRLGYQSTFQEYLRQMYEECMVTPAMDPARDCPVVISSFKQVGVDYPSGVPMPKLPAPPPLPGPAPAPLPQKNEPQPSPLLKLCGWVSVKPSNNVTIIDNKYDTVILAANYPKLTQGDFSAIYRLKCACAQGHISQIANSKAVWFNYFSDVVAIQERPVDACKPIVFK